MIVGLRRASLAVAVAVATVAVASCATAGSDDTTPSPPSSPAPTPSVAAPTEPARPSGYGELVLVAAADGLVDATITGPDGEREMVIHVPDGPTEGAPLLVALHPFTFTGSQFDRLTDLGSEGAARGAVVVFPDGLFASWNGSAVCCPPAASRGVDDVGFVREIVAQLRDQLGVDPARTWVTGFSNGGYLAIRLACEASDVVTAVAPHAASMDLPCEPDEPVSVLVSHGEEDRIVPFDGQRRSERGPEVDLLGAREVAQRFRDLGDCPAAAPTASPATSDDTTAAPCAGGTEVRLVVWPGVEHAWPVPATEVIFDWFESDAGRRGASSEG